MEYIKGTAREQIVLFPEALDEYITEDNPVQFIEAFVNSLDLNELQFKHGELNETGRPPYDPRDLLNLYIYGYLNGIRSSRKLEKETRRNVELMWLLRKLTPDFKTIADFRKDNKKAIKSVCKEFIFLCKKLSLFGGELVAIDGSKFRAVNSKKRNFNERKLERKIRELEDKIDRYLEELDEHDEEERDVRTPEREEMKEKIEEFKKRRKDYKKLMQRLKESEEMQVSLTDPDSRSMVSNKRIEVGYNVQFTVDEKHKLILDHEVTNEVKDQHQLSRMAKRAKRILGKKKIEVLADKGYYNAKEVKECVDNGIMPYIPEAESRVSKKVNIPRPEFYEDKFRYDKGKDVYICPEGAELTYRYTTVHYGKRMRLYKSRACRRCQSKELCTRQRSGRFMYRWEHEEVLEDMRKRVKEEKEKVKIRQCLTEHPIGTLKRGFNQGYFLTRGLEKTGAEMSLSVLAYNIKRVINIIGLEKLIDYVGIAKDLIFSYFLFLRRKIGLNIYKREINPLALSNFRKKGQIRFSYHTV